MRQHYVVYRAESTNSSTIQANHLTFEDLVNKLDGSDNVEAGFLEGTDGPEIARGRISDDCAYVAVHENVPPSKFPDNGGPQPTAGHLQFSYRDVDPS